MHPNGAAAGGPEFVESPAFYDELADHYDDIAAERRPYLNSIDQLLRTHKTDTQRMLDVGCGDGSRIDRLARSLGVEDLWLVDSSAGMAQQASKTVPWATVRRADVSDHEQCCTLEGSYDLITCLGNIFGHMAVQQRIDSLQNLKSLLAPGGSIFLDLNNRYNVAQYGLRRVVANVVSDVVGQDRGDFHTTRVIDRRIVTTQVHLTTHREMTDLLRSAGLRPRATWFVHYGDGRLVRSSWQGQIVMDVS